MARRTKILEAEYEQVDSDLADSGSADYDTGDGRHDDDDEEAPGVGHNRRGPPDDVINKHIAACSDALWNAKSEQSKYSNAIKAAEKDGVNTKALKWAFQQRDRPFPEVISELNAKIHILSLMNMPVTQAELFGDGEPKRDPRAHPDPLNALQEMNARIWEADGEGLNAGAGGRSRSDHRHAAGSPEADSFDSGWVRGNKRRVEHEEGA